MDMMGNIWEHDDIYDVVDVHIVAALHHSPTPSQGKKGLVSRWDHGKCM